MRRELVMGKAKVSNRSDLSGGQDSLAGVLRIVLRPIARYCLRHSLKFRRISEILKSVLVEIAQEELSKKGAPASISRLSAMTGVHRKDVTRLVLEDMQERPAADVYTRIVGQWKNHPSYSRRGEARPLDVSGGQGKFAALVSSVSKELNPYLVLFEFERLGIVEREGDLVVLSAAEFVPRRNLDASFRMVEADIDDLLRAVEENTLKKPATANLHLTTRYDNVAPEHLPEIRRWFINEGAKLHKAARNYLSKFDKDLNPKLKGTQGGSRVALGSFSITDQPMKRPKQ